MSLPPEFGQLATTTSTIEHGRKRGGQRAIRGCCAAPFAIDAKSGKLRHLGNGPLAGSMAYIAIDRSGKFLLSASCPGHSVSVNPIGTDGFV